ncbi:MAG: hypothetical protein SNJ59_02525 [Aggregatilineales bacterium]
MLGHWVARDPELQAWLKPRLERFSGDGRKSVAKRASRLLAVFY